MLRKLGTFVEFSVFMGETSVDWSIIGDRKELTIKGAHISGKDGYRIAINMLETGRINIDPIVTHKYPLAEFKKAFEIAENGEESIKTVLIS
jgi:L-iditol 2-dehydrogenase